MVEHIHALFAQLSQALHGGDIVSFRGMVRGTDPFLEEVFVEESQKLTQLGATMQLRALHQDEGAATLDFAMVDAGGVVRAHGCIKVVQGDLGWYVDDL